MKVSAKILLLFLIIATISLAATSPKYEGEMATATASKTLLVINTPLLIPEFALMPVTLSKNILYSYELNLQGQVQLAMPSNLPKAENGTTENIFFSTSDSMLYGDKIPLKVPTKMAYLSPLKANYFITTSKYFILEKSKITHIEKSDFATKCPLTGNYMFSKFTFIYKIHSTRIDTLYKSLKTLQTSKSGVSSKSSKESTSPQKLSSNRLTISFVVTTPFVAVLLPVEKDFYVKIKGISVDYSKTIFLGSAAGGETFSFTLFDILPGKYEIILIWGGYSHKEVKEIKKDFDLVQIMWYKK